MSATRCIPAPCVVIAEDAMSVTLKAADEFGVASSTTPANLLAYLHHLGISVPDPKAIEALAGSDGCIKPTEDIVLATGKAAVPQRRGRIELLVGTEPAGDDASSSLNHYDRSPHRTAKADQAIAKIHPVTPGEDGRNVFGNVIVHAKVREPVTLGRNVMFADDGITVIATAPGRVCLARRKLWVETTVEVNGDVDFSCGNIDVAGDVRIGGSVLDMFKVRGANIEVGAAIEAADINAIYDLAVRGGILGKDKGRCAAGGDVSFKYASNSTISAGGNVRSRGEVKHCRIICRGELVIERDPLTGGWITANGGVVCQTLGSSLETKTLVEVGSDEFLRLSGPAKVAEIAARKARAARLAFNASQLLRFQEQLTPAQRQQAVELQQEAEQTDATAQELLEPLQAELTASRERCKAEVVVTEMLHAGVTIRFPSVEATIENEWHGPLRIVATNANDKPQVMLITTERNTCHPLPSRPRSDVAYDAFLRAMKP
jgi:uncharacterized protein (DUF342 family)